MQRDCQYKFMGVMGLSDEDARYLAGIKGMLKVTTGLMQKPWGVQFSVCSFQKNAFFILYTAI